jgi:hypothetical protein
VAFDRLFDCAKLHVQAGVYLSRPWPFEVIAMAMLLEHHKRLEQMLARLEALDNHLRPASSHTLEAPPDPPALMRPMTSPLLPLEEGWRDGQPLGGGDQGGAHDLLDGSP